MVAKGLVSGKEKRVYGVLGEKLKGEELSETIAFKDGRLHN